MRTLSLFAVTAAIGVSLFIPNSSAQSRYSRLFLFTNIPDAADPQGIVIGPDGAFYGMSSSGGSSNCYYFGCGTVFRLQPPAKPSGRWTETVLYGFTDQNGDGSVGYPAPPPIFGPNGVLYGVTGFGGVNNTGTVWTLTPPSTPGGAWTESVIYTFPGTAGFYPGNPNAILFGNDGLLYGLTYYGGTFNNGSVFQLSPPSSPGGAWTGATLYSFTGSVDGSSPSGLIAGPNGVFYGTTYGGGDWGAGVVFELDPPVRAGLAWTENVLYSFTGGADGSGPNEPMNLVSKGTLYGTTRYGGATNAGTVFQLQQTDANGPWTETVLYSFTQGTGVYPESPLFIRNGNIWGSTSALNGGDPILGAPGSGGAVYELKQPATPGAPWTEVPLHQFFNDAFPYGNLFVDQGGTLYGVTLDSNTDGGWGFFYKLEP